MESPHIVFSYQQIVCYFVSTYYPIFKFITHYRQPACKSLCRKFDESDWRAGIPSRGRFASWLCGQRNHGREWIPGVGLETRRPPQSQPIRPFDSSTSTDSLDPLCYPRIGKASATRRFRSRFSCWPASVARRAHSSLRCARSEGSCDTELSSALRGSHVEHLRDAGGGRPWRSISETPEPVCSRRPAVTSGRDRVLRCAMEGACSLSVVRDFQCEKSKPWELNGDPSILAQAHVRFHGRPKRTAISPRSPGRPQRKYSDSRSVYRPLPRLICTR